MTRTVLIMKVSPGVHGAGAPAPATRCPAPALALAGRAARTLGRHAAVLHPVRRPPPGEQQSVEEAVTSQLWLPLLDPELVAVLVLGQHVLEGDGGGVHGLEPVAV